MNLITPKANAKLERIIPALIFISEGNPMESQIKFKREYLHWFKKKYSLDEFNDIKDLDQSTIWNFTEIWRYIGIMIKDQHAKYKISPAGIDFIDEYTKSGITNKLKEILIKSILRTSYSKENASARNSSNISIPHALFAFFIRKENFKKVEFMNFLFSLLLTNDVEKSMQKYNDIISSIEGDPSGIFKKYRSKMQDIKLITLLINFGVIIVDKGSLSLWSRDFIEGDVVKFADFNFIPQQNVLTINYLLQKKNKEKRRKSGLTLKAVIDANFTCEYDEEHKTFKWKGKDGQYMEGHHLIPIEVNDFFKDVFKYDADMSENIFSLCPNCHSVFRSGEIEEVKKIVIKLFGKRQSSYLKSNITRDMVIDVYKNDLYKYIENN